MVSGTNVQACERSAMVEEYPQCESRLQRVVDQQQTLPCKETGLYKRMK